MKSRLFTFVLSTPPHIIKVQVYIYLYIFFKNTYENVSSIIYMVLHTQLKETTYGRIVVERVP